MSSSTDTTQRAGRLITKTECCNLFCEEFGISESSYFKFFRPFLKFKSTGSSGRIPLIPREVVVSIINILGFIPKEDDYPAKNLDIFIKSKFYSGNHLNELYCCVLFCKRLDIHQVEFFERYLPYLNFDVKHEGESGKSGGIPFRIVNGLINQLLGEQDDSDPHPGEMDKYRKKQD